MPRHTDTATHIGARRVAGVAGILLVAALGGVAGNLLGLRAPWFFGALIAALGAGMALPRAVRPKMVPPRPLVRGFVALLAVLFGSRLGRGMQFDPASWLPAALGVILFVLAAQVLGYLLFRRLGGLDPATAWFSATPGGLVESAAQGESAGADQAQIALLHFLRVMILLGLPLAYSLWFGPAPQTPGQLLAPGPAAGPGQTGIVLLTLAASMLTARKLPLPGGALILPFAAGAALAAAGALQGAGMPLALAAAQIVLGASLGARFATLSPPAVFRTARLALAQTALLAALALAFAALLSQIAGLPVWLGLLIMAPAGIAEMAVIGLSLGADPVFIIAFHALRMGAALLVLPWLFRRFIAAAPRR